MRYVYHHLGLGDSILCNGLVRHFAEKLGKVSIFSKRHNYDSLKFMYRDEPNITVIPVDGSDSKVMEYLSTAVPPFKYKPILNTIKVGFEHLWSNASNPNAQHYSPSPGFDVRFYEIVGLNFKYRWDKFKIIRDSGREQKLFDHFGLKNKDYIFVHDDNRFRVDLNRIDIKNVEIIKPIDGLTSNIFDYCSIIENAKEVHTIESSFQFMIDSICLNRENYVHRYPRYLTAGEVPIYQSVKKIIV